MNELTQVARAVTDKYMAEYRAGFRCVRDPETGHYAGTWHWSTTPTPWDINSGDCERWADEVACQVPGAETLWLDEVEGYEEYSHCVVVYQGRFYDSESPEGVDSLDEIPMVKGYRENDPRYCGGR